MIIPHSLLLNRGLIRVFLPWPPHKADGTRIEPEFTIEVMRDPTGCNRDPQYGLASSNPTILRASPAAHGGQPEIRDCGCVRRLAIHRQRPACRAIRRPVRSSA